MSPDTLVRCSYYARLLPLPNRRLRDARRRRRGRLRAPERHLQPGVPQLAESGARGVRPRAHRRRAVQSRERACLRPSHASAKQIQICQSADAILKVWLFLFFVFLSDMSTPERYDVSFARR
jgi:hypothetical protein